MSQPRAKDELVSMFGKKKPLGGEGMTVKEICERTGRGPNWVRMRISEGIQSRRIKVGTRPKRTISGTLHHSPIYIFVKGE